ncbi:MAG: regulatory protein RecX [Planctomycetota bacterium]|nr:regulatory protein RecX [Planctomycetota bacterium]
MADKLTSVPPGAPIDRLRPVSRERVAVVVAGRSVCLLPAREAARLGLEAGRAWTAGLAAKVRPAAERDEALGRALRLLAARPRSRGELLERLSRAGVREEVAAEIVDRLQASGHVDDAAYAKLYAQSLADSGKGAGKRLIVAKLRRRRVAGDVADRAAREACAGRDEQAEADALAARKWRTMPEKLEVHVRARRVLGALARRGFAPGIAAAAVRKLARGVPLDEMEE